MLKCRLPIPQFYGFHCKVTIFFYLVSAQLVEICIWSGAHNANLGKSTAEHYFFESSLILRHKHEDKLTSLYKTYLKNWPLSIIERPQLKAMYFLARKTRISHHSWSDNTKRVLLRIGNAVVCKQRFTWNYVYIPFKGEIL